MSKAKNIECRCESNFTCGYCLRNAPPPVFTPLTLVERVEQIVERENYRQVHGRYPEDEG